MRRSLTAIALFACCGTFLAGQRTAGVDFSRTMRVDYFHTGGAGGEAVRLDAVLAEGAWPDSRTHLIDATNLGKYFFEVIDRASERVLYSRGFASIYGEWETIPEFRTTTRTFHESLRFPWPNGPVRVVLKKRDRQNRFEPLWTTEIDPRMAAAVPIPPTAGPALLFENGPAHRKVDLLLISEGYSIEQAAKFRADAARLVEALFALEPFRSRRADFNVRTLAVRGAQLSVQFNVFGLERYALTYDNRALRNLAASAPYDIVEVLMNESKYGGGGIFNQQSTVAASNESAEYVFIHELAHNLAGLGDEYVGTVTYATGAPIKVEPWEPNVTALHDPSSLKWRDLVQPGTPVPTPMTHAGKVGAFEGAGYEARGLYRPEAECIMGSRTVTTFCRVCQRAINRVIDLHTK
ncbi:MAG: peptidase M64 [Acidobacteria bacterium]|nr:MAG: peptidase M64 [Acidobacteriota bacterium]